MVLQKRYYGNVRPKGKTILNSESVNVSVKNNEQIIFKHVLIADFVKIERGDVVYAFFCISTKKYSINIIGEQQVHLQTNKGQYISPTAYGVVVKSENEVIEVMNKVKDINENNYKEMRMEENVSNLEKQLGEKVEIILLNENNVKTTFEKSKFDLKVRKTKGELIEKGRKLVRDYKD
jgi:hypothetical protein